jgi:molybdopterin-containing oxidoreductase family membrane subunit
MKKSEAGHSVIGFFATFDALLAAVRAAQKENYGRLRTISPVPLPEVDDLLASKPSPVRMFTLAGGLVGFLTGWALTIGSVEHYPIIVGGKPLISLTPFGVVAYICTILFGSLFTVAGMLINARLPKIQVGRDYDPRLTGNRFGLQVICGQEQLAAVERKLLECGAEEVKYVEV